MNYFLGFGVTAFFIPGLIGAATSPRWALLSLMTPWFYRAVPMTVGHWLGVTLIAWCAFTLLWTPSMPPALRDLWYLIVIGGVYCYASRQESLERVYVGAAIGMGVSSAMVLLQWFQIMTPVYINAAQSEAWWLSGTFINAALLAQAAALVFVGCIAYRLWWALPLIAPCLILSPQRTALLSIVVGLLMWRIRLGLLLIVGGVMTLLAAGSLGLDLSKLWRINTIDQRLDYWTDAWEALTLWGYGIGSFRWIFPAVSYRVDPLFLRLDYVHNDFLQFAFEMGVGVFLLFALVGYSFMRVHDASRMVLAAFVTQMVLWFPLHLPAHVFFGALAAGHFATRRHGVYTVHDDGRSSLRSLYSTCTEPFRSRRGLMASPSNRPLPRLSSARTRSSVHSLSHKSSPS